MKPALHIANRLKTDWLDWWAGLSSLARWLPAVGVGFYGLLFAAMGGFHWGTVKTGLGIAALAYAGRVPRRILVFFLPLLLTGLCYESLRYVGDGLRGTIHVAEPYYFDLRFFGIETSAGRLTPNEWWQLHTHWLLDLIAGIGYIGFIPIFLCLAAGFEFYYSRTGTPKLPAREIAAQAPRMMWSFFWVNLLGYSTYYWYPAAPPWYAALYGLGPANLNAPPNPAGCLRFDELLGVPVFTEFYSHSANIFGAIPSLHIAYPLVAVYFAFRFGALRTVSVLYYLLLCFGAVYLNHHYILDLIWGSAYAVGISWLVDTLPALLKPQPLAEPATLSE